MAKDFTKYRIEGIGENFNKARLVQKVITHFCENENPDFEDLKLTWFDDLQGGKGVVRLLSQVDDKNTRNYYVDAPIQLKDGSVAVVCNQWGKDNLANFIYLAGFHGYKIYSEDESDKIKNEVDNTNSNIDVTLSSSIEGTDDLSSVSGSPNWGVSESIAFLVRHAIISDNEVLDEELNWMHVAFNEFEKENIDVKSVWELVDNQAQLYSEMGYYDNMFSSVVTFLNVKLSKSQKSDLLAILMEICSADGIIREAEYVTLMVIAGVFYPGKERSVILEPFMKAGLKIEGSQTDNLNEVDSTVLPQAIIENLTQEENVDENLFFVFNYVKDFVLNNDELEKLYLNIITLKPDAQIAGQYALELFQKGKIDVAKQIINNKHQYNGDDFSWNVFDKAVKEISINLEKSVFEEYESNNGEDLTLKINIFGNLHHLFQCRKDAEQEIQEIENHYENTLSSFFKIDSDNLMVVELNDQKIFEGPIEELGINEKALNVVEDTDNTTRNAFADNFNDIKKIKRFSNMNPNEFLVSSKNNLIVVNETSGALGYSNGRNFAPEFENRYTMVEYGKYHIQTIPVKLKKFKLNDLFFQKDTGMEDLIGTSADGIDYCFSLIFHKVLGELEFEIQNNNVNDTEFYEGWMDEA